MSDDRPVCPVCQGTVIGIYMPDKLREIIFKLGFIVDIGMKSDVVWPLVRINRPAIPGNNDD